MEVLSIFYNEIIKEACAGQINCYFTYNLMFGTIISEENIKLIPKDNGLIVPILNINNKKLFDELLTRYVSVAKEFYKNKMKDEESVTKAILATLFSNANYEDFENPIAFLQRRITFFENNLDDNIYNQTDYGDITINIQNDSYLNETPYKMQITFSSDEEKYYLPVINFGIQEDTVYIYAIHNVNVNTNKYSKKLKRLFYKINDGYIPNEGFNGLDKDITPSFVVALSIFLKHFENLGFNKFKANSLLISRYNAKAMANRKRRERLIEVKENQDENFVQNNLTDKFLNTFYRLINNSSGLTITDFPYPGSYLEIHAQNITYNNEFLNSMQASGKKML